MDIFIYFIFSFAVYIQICEGLYGCNESIPTISYVESCPKNKTEWNIAARRKNCNSLAALQKCTKPEDFQYHCLENQWQTMTLEICAPIFYLQGYCARYSTDKKRVEENYDSGFECLKFDESERCPTRYPSTDAYKYQRCYKLKYQKPTQTACPICTSPSSQSETTPIVTKEDLRNDTDDSTKTVFLVILALALAGVIAFFILFYKRKSPYLESFFKVRTSDEETGPVDGTENEEDIQPQELTNEVDESSHLLSDETGRDEKATSDKDLAPNDSTISEPISGNNQFEKDTPPSAPLSNDGIDVSHSSSIDIPSSTPIIGDDPEKLNADKDIVSNAKSKQEPLGDKPMPYNEIASIQKSDTLLNSSSNLDTNRFMKAKSDDNSLSKPKSIDVSLSQVKSDTKNTSKPSESENDPTEISIPANNKTEDKSRDAYEEKFNENPPKSNNGHNLKPLSNENIKSTSLEASDSRQVSNDKSAADPLSASHTSSSNVSPMKSSKDDIKEVVIDDSKEIPTGMPAESQQSLIFDKSSSALSKENTSGSKAPDNSVSSSDKMAQNGTDVFKPNLQNQAAAKSTPKDVPASDDAPVLTLATDNSTPGNGRSSAPMSENNPFDEDTSISELSNGNPTPDSKASKPISGNNPFDEDTTTSVLSGYNPLEEDTPPTCSQKSKRAPEPPRHTTKINVTQKPSFGRKKPAPPPPPPSELPK